MRGKLIVAAGAGLAAVAVAAFAHASPSQGSSTITIHTLQLGTGVKWNDLDRNGKPSVGDVTVLYARHFDLKTHKPLGGGTAICTQLDDQGLVYDCIGEDHFAGGDIREAARFRLGKGFTFAILGGTGAYVGASGELKGTWLDAKATKARDTFTIIR